MLLYSGDKVGKTQSLDNKYRSICSSISISISCSSLLCFSSLGRNCDTRLRNGSLCKKSIKSQTQVDQGRENKKTRLCKTGGFDSRKRFSLRLRPRLRLLRMRLKRVSSRAVLEEIRMYLSKNLRNVTFSSFVAVLLGICYMFLKLTAVPLPKAVPYSDLIMNLQSRSVQNVLFEEGSRHIYYNTVPESSNDPQLLENPTPSEDVVSSENVGDTGVLANQTKKLCVLGGSVLGKFTKKKVSAREWQYSTRKIDQDEKFLLTLMREKGTAYSSAPQSVLMSMRNILITIFSLWIPLTPLMWLLYRQASAANSPAKKRRPTNQIVSFDDVEGVDTAKAELLEEFDVNFLLSGIPMYKVVLLFMIIFAVIPTVTFNIYNVAKVMRARKGSMLVAFAMLYPFAVLLGGALLWDYLSPCDPMAEYPHLFIGGSGLAFGFLVGRMVLAHLCDEPKGLKTGMCMSLLYLPFAIANAISARFNDGIPWVDEGWVLLGYCVFTADCTCILRFPSSMRSPLL